MFKNSRRKRWLFRILLGLLVFAGLVGLGCYFFPQKLLTVESGSVNADVIVILGGGPTERSNRALDLFNEGAARKILISGSGDCRQGAKILEQGGIAHDAITLECSSHTTLENAKFSVPLLRELGARRVIVVTSWYHSRRALACFKHFAPEIQFFSRPSYAQYDRKQWNRGTGSYVRSEYIKNLGYWLRYGVCPF
jgi:uncharacterized SAM-binding protein YcdF (DUF218 family)